MILEKKQCITLSIILLLDIDEGKFITHLDHNRIIKNLWKLMKGMAFGWDVIISSDGKPLKPAGGRWETWMEVNWIATQSNQQKCCRWLSVRAELTFNTTSFFIISCGFLKVRWKSKPHYTTMGYELINSKQDKLNLNWEQDFYLKNSSNI